MEQHRTRFDNLFGSYGFAGSLFLIKDILLTRLAMPGVRLVRRPLFIRGKASIRFGKHFSAGRRLRLEGREPIITFGERVRINDDVHIAGQKSVQIGNRVLIASKVFITDHGHGIYSGEAEHSSPLSAPDDRALQVQPVVVEDDVWLGEMVTVLPGTRIGRGSVIGSMSVVSRNIPAYCIAVGAPAKVIKRYNFDTLRWEHV